MAFDIGLANQQEQPQRPHWRYLVVSCRWAWLLVLPPAAFCCPCSDQAAWRPLLPSRSDPTPHATRSPDSAYSTHPWNLSVMPRQSGRYSSLLRVLDGNIAGGRLLRRLCAAEFGVHQSF